MEVLESRRLTGPNLVSDQPGAVLQVAADERAIELWRSRARAMLDAVGWHDERVGVRTFRGGADLFVSAPIDALYAACELNEWAATQTPLEEAARRIAEVIEQERNPKLLALRDAATAHDVCFLWDDDFVSAGMGEGSLVWATDDLPAAEEVDWNAVHDVPTVLVTGTNGKSTTVRLVASMVKAAGRIPGFCTTDYIRIGDQTLDEGDWTGPGATRKVLRHRRTQVAILEVARGGLLRRGLGVERADAAAILNVSADHLGEFGVDDVATLVTTKFLVARAARRLVLNADDEGVRARGNEVEMPVTWFSLSPEVEGCVLADGVLTLFEQTVASVEEVPVTFGGAARFNIANALAAIGLAAAIHIPLPAIAQGLRSFENSPEANPGRSNVFQLGGVTAIVDYAHNPDGFAALLEMTATMPAQRRLITLGQAGDRTDEAIETLARTAWESGPDRIVLKQMTKYLRGRKAGEVVEIMARALERAGAPADRIGRAASETEAVEQALAWARDGDLLLFSIQAERGAVIERLTALQKTGWRAGA